MPACSARLFVCAIVCKTCQLMYCISGPLALLICCNVLFKWVWRLQGVCMVLGSLRVDVPNRDPPPGDTLLWTGCCLFLQPALQRCYCSDLPYHALLPSGPNPHLPSHPYLHPPPLGGPTTPCPILRTTATHPGPPFPHSLCSSLTPSLFFPHANPPHPALVQGMCDCCTSAVLIEYGWTASLSRGGTLSSVHVHISRSQLLAWLAANLRPKWVLNVEEEIAH